MTRADALKTATARLQGAGIDTASDDARRLMLHALDLSSASLVAHADKALSQADTAKLQTLIERRANREPLSHILGKVGFWTLDLEVSSDVLTPRADTETIVEAALASVPDKTAPLRVLDVATGSGAILLALLSELTNATGIGTDISAPALAIARRNAQANQLGDRARFIETSWTDGLDDGLDGVFDVMTSNPPYIETGVIKTLDREVKDFEPHIALDGGPDGLAPYPHLFSQAKRLLRPGGVGVFEIGYDQGARASTLAEAHGLSDVAIKTDLSGQNRAIVFTYSP